MKKVNKLDKSILQLSEGKGPTNKLKMENGVSVNITEQKDNGEMLHPPLNFRIARTSPHHDPVEEVGTDVTLQKLRGGRGKPC